MEKTGGFDAAILHLLGHHHQAYTVDHPIDSPFSQSLLDRTGILVLTDKFDELLTGFGGATPCGPPQAIQRLYLDAQQYGLNKNILAQFISVVGIYPVHSHVKLNTNKTAVVTALIARKLHQPVITVTHDAEGIECQEPLPINLAHQKDQEHPRSITLVLDEQPLSDPLDFPARRRSASLPSHHESICQNIEGSLFESCITFE